MKGKRHACTFCNIVFFELYRKELFERLHNFVNLNLCLALSCGLILFIAGIEHVTGNKVNFVKIIK